MHLRLPGVQSAGVVAEGLEAASFVEGLLLGFHNDQRFQGTKTPEPLRFRFGGVCGWVGVWGGGGGWDRLFVSFAFTGDGLESDICLVGGRS